MGCLPMFTIEIYKNQLKVGKCIQYIIHGMLYIYIYKYVYIYIYVNGISFSSGSRYPSIEGFQLRFGCTFCFFFYIHSTTSTIMFHVCPLFLGFEPYKRRPFLFKTRVIWVPGLF